MITEDYISCETAKLLKEKGFREHCTTAYYPKTTPGVRIECPTLQMAMKWLREVHNCYICVQALITTDGLQGYCPFYTKVGDVFMWQNVLGDDYATTQTYEEACEAAIKYCLENLI